MKLLRKVKPEFCWIVYTIQTQAKHPNVKILLAQFNKNKNVFLIKKNL